MTRLSSRANTKSVGAAGSPLTGMPLNRSDVTHTRQENPIAVHLSILLGAVVSESAVGFLIQSWAQKSTTAVSTAVVFAMEPVMAALFSWWLIGELLSWTAAFGGVLMIAGMLVAELGLPWQKKAIEEE